MSEVKIYGRVQKVQKNGEGVVFAKLEDLNNKGKDHVICSGTTENLFGDNRVLFKEGLRVAFTGSSNGSFCLVSGDVKVYEDKKKGAGRDTSGMEIGHALNGSFSFYNHKKTVKDSEVIETAKLVHDITSELKKEWAEETGMDETSYDVGATVGHAVLNACRQCTKTEDIKERALAIMRGPVAEIGKYVRGE